MKALRVLGVMTGTSCDGLDAACIEIRGHSDWVPLWASSAPYPEALRRRVLEVQRPESKFSSRNWLELDRDLGEWYGAALNRVMRNRQPRPDLIANHGQTIAHFPQPRGKGVTGQLGDPARIVRATGLTVAFQFRTGDMAAGGQGAPLVPLFHGILADRLGGRALGVAIHNLGGFSNLSYFGPNHCLAFDTGPASCWIDAAASRASHGKLRMDRGGKLAARGKPDEAGLRRILKHPFFALPIPKSTGRDDFPDSFFLSRTRATGNDLIATATAVTVESIVDSYRRHILKRGLPLRRIYFCGGGAANASIVDGVRVRLDGVEVRDLADDGFDARIIEAQAFAYYGYLSLLGKPLGGSWTGASGLAPGGQLLPGANWAEVLRKTSAIR